VFKVERLISIGTIAAYSAKHSAVVVVYCKKLKAGTSLIKLSARYGFAELMNESI